MAVERLPTEQRDEAKKEEGVKRDEKSGKKLEGKGKKEAKQDSSKKDAQKGKSSLTPRPE